MTMGIIGVDEAGRGPLAGPVAVGACFASPQMIREFRSIKESKQLSPAQRDLWYQRMITARGRELAFVVSFVSAHTIDKVGITRAIALALHRSLGKLERNNARSTFAWHMIPVLLDGGLRAPSRYSNQQTIIGGDARETIIAMASVVAKVERDRLMRRLHNKYPHYGWNNNAGYGTRLHLAAIEKYGYSPEHRRTFIHRRVAHTHEMR